MTDPEAERSAWDELQCYTLAHGDPRFLHQYVVDAWMAQHAHERTKPIGLAFALGGIQLAHQPGTAAWWRARPLWMATLVVMLFPLVLLFSRFERPKASATPPPAWRLVLGASLLVYGLAQLALDGIGGSGWLGLRPVVLALPFAGAALIGIGPGGKREPARA